MTVFIGIFLWYVAGIFTIWFADAFTGFPVFRKKEIRIGDLFLGFLSATCWPAILSIAVMIIFEYWIKNGGGPVVYKRKKLEKSKIDPLDR